MPTSAPLVATAAVTAALVALTAGGAAADPLVRAVDPAASVAVVPADPVAPVDPYRAPSPAVAAPGDTQPAIAPPPRPPLRPRWQVSISGLLRITRLDEYGDRFADEAEAYGWRGARAAPLLGGSLDVSYLHAPIVDLGVTASWTNGSYAVGIDLVDDVMTVRAAALGVSARLHWMAGRSFVPEPRLDVGVISERTDVHGEQATHLSTYLRAGIDWRLGSPTVGAVVALGYTMVERDRDRVLAPPLGGLDLSVGPYFRF